jgi:hypothetical protein
MMINLDDLYLKPENAKRIVPLPISLSAKEPVPYACWHVELAVATLGNRALHLNILEEGIPFAEEFVSFLKREKIPLEGLLKITIEHFKPELLPPPASEEE